MYIISVLRLLLCLSYRVSYDIRFLVEGEIIPAHRYVLVLRSNWFRALLGHQWKESTNLSNNNNNNNNDNNGNRNSNSNSDNNGNTNNIHTENTSNNPPDAENQSTTLSTPIPIQDISAKLFYLLLQFIYLDDLAIEQGSEDKLPELLISADRFSLIRLKVSSLYISFPSTLFIYISKSYLLSPLIESMRATPHRRNRFRKRWEFL